MSTFLTKLQKILLSKRFWLLIILLALFIFACNLFRAPENFEADTVVVIESGQTVKDVADLLKENHIIKSDSMFSLFMTVSKSQAVAGNYIFKKKENLFGVVKRIAQGNYGATTVSITFFEGMTNAEMAQTIHSYFPNFNVEEFLELTKDKEGYLFPDTYRISDIMSPRQILKLLETNFSNKIGEVGELLEESKYSLAQIITMASIVEKEANLDSKQEVANILWKRYEENFPLQVDAPFVYSIGRNSYTLYLDDLRDDSNPYNTYAKTGLTPTPISNPGLEAIKAAANPAETKYFYFLTGRDGRMHYAETFEGHKQNRLRYLD